jgi:hypothetical protein
MEIKGESFTECFSRKTRNAWACTVGLASKSSMLTSVQIKKLEMQSRKKQFGIDYLNLERSGATNDELQACIDSARDDIERLAGEIDNRKAKMAGVDEKTREKLVKRPPSWNLPTVTVTPDIGSPASESPATSSKQDPTNSVVIADAYVVGPSAPPEHHDAK